MPTSGSCKGSQPLVAAEDSSIARASLNVAGMPRRVQQDDRLKADHARAMAKLTSQHQEAAKEASQLMQQKETQRQHVLALSRESEA